MLFIPLRKVDAAQRLVYGRLDETPDRGGDVFDYASSKPNFEAWSEDMRKASDGKSLGNIRAMHGLKAAGKVTGLDFNDADKAIEICAHIVDDDEWKKVEEGVYTGFSPGGKFTRRWRDGAFTRYTGKPNEISLVDIPANPAATFAMVKADGSELAMQLAAGEGSDQALLVADLASVETRADYRRLLLAQDSAMVKALFPAEGAETWRAVIEAQGLVKRDYDTGERDTMAKSGQALPDGSFPIADKTDLEDAIEAYGRAKHKAMAKAHIEKRAKDLEATDLLPADWEGSTKAPMKKDLDHVSRMAGLIQSLGWLANSVSCEADREQDGSPLPGRIAAWLSEGAIILQAFATEESSELVAGLKAQVAALPMLPDTTGQTAEMAKVGARHSKTDLEHVQAIHDHAASLGACCPGDMAKAAGMTSLPALAAELAGAREDMRKIEGERNTLQKRVAALEAKPAGGGPRLRAFGRGEDIPGTPSNRDADEALKLIEAMRDGPNKTAALIRHHLEHPERT